MLFTLATDYAIRALVYLAGKDQEVVCLPEISKAINVSDSYLRAVFMKLKKAGIVSTTSGKYGGVSLKVKPCDINLLDIVNTTEVSSKISCCMSDKNICGNIKPCNCVLRRDYKTLQNMIESYLRNISIEDLMQ